MTGVFVAGVGKYVPAQVVTNDDMAKIVDTSDEWISQRTGIRERHFSEGETNYYMGARAAEEALEDAGINGSDVDMIIGCTITPDYFYPSLAAIIQDEIGAQNAFCWDLSAACSGFIYALDVARHYLMTGKKNILIVCSEVMSKQLDFTDRSTCVLFGDGAAAALIQPAEGSLFGSFLKTEGSLGGAILARALDTQGMFATNKDDPKYHKYEETNGNFVKMLGRDVYRFATKAMPDAIEGACEAASVDVSELDLIVPHQANIRIIQTAAQRLNVSMDKIYTNVDRYGNTSSVSIPLCLAELKAAGSLKRGQKLGLVGFGGGLTYGAIILEW